MATKAESPVAEIDPVTLATKAESPVAEVDPVPLTETADDFNFVAESDSDGDRDSTYGESTFSDTTSISSSVLQYSYENGRRYNAFRGGVNYVLPNDEEEQDRLDLTHHLWLLVGGGDIIKAPIQSPQKVLDLGTGTGIWAIEFGDRFPSAEVIGTDLSVIQPVWVPPNVKFEIDDCEDEWLYRKNSFDYIHTRNLVGAIKDWPNLIKNVYEFVLPAPT